MKKKERKGKDKRNFKRKETLLLQHYLVKNLKEEIIISFILARVNREL